MACREHDSHAAVAASQKLRVRVSRKGVICNTLKMWRIEAQKPARPLLRMGSR